MLHVCSHENFIFELRIIKLHSKMILQQTPSSVSAAWVIKPARNEDDEHLIKTIVKSMMCVT